MPVNPYDSCPCGSGKKFKFCCEKYFDRIQQVYRLREGNQHDAALRAFEQVTRDYPDTAAVWGFFASYLYSENLPEKAEAALARAFELNPNFGMGFLIRANKLLEEHEAIGALLMLRKAEAAFDPTATNSLMEVYGRIAELELLLHHPIACHMAYDRLLQIITQEPEIRQQYDQLFGEGSSLPAVARKTYTLRPTVKPTPADSMRERLVDLKDRFQKLCDSVPDDPAAWFNLGLVLAWLGEQSAAIQALEQSLEKEWDDRKAEETAALMEVLSFGAGMEDECDYLEYRRYMGVRDSQAVLKWMERWAQENRLIGIHSNPERRMITGIVIEEIPSLIETGTIFARHRARLILQEGTITLASPNEESVAALAEEVRSQLNLAVTEAESGQGILMMTDVPLASLPLPIKVADPAQFWKKRMEMAQNYFEEVWAKQPRRSLSGVSPLDAAGSSRLRKRLLGVIKFEEDCYQMLRPKTSGNESPTPTEDYDFGRLRHKLGAEIRPAGEAPKIEVPADLVATAQPEVTATTGHTVGTADMSRPVAATSPPADFSMMNAAELAAVPVETLSVPELEQAMRAAVKLDARELAVRFAAAGVALPADPAKPDRYTFFVCLLTKAVSDGDLDSALKHIEAGTADDALNNSGKRADDFSLHKAKLYAKRGDIAAASQEFDALLARQPSEGKYYIAASEAMLSARNREQALRYAQAGLAQARSSNNRDLEAACLELSEAASRQSR